MQTFDNLFFNGKDQMIQFDNLNNSEYFCKRNMSGQCHCKLFKKVDNLCTNIKDTIQYMSREYFVFFNLQQ